jgi:hypothetical protein
MKNLQNIVLATVLVGLVSLVGYIVLNKKDTKPINEMPVVEAEFSTPAGSTTATTTDWTTYTNAQYGFEFKYSTGWYVYNKYQQTILLKSEEYPEIASEVYALGDQIVVRKETLLGAWGKKISVSEFLNNVSTQSSEYEGGVTLVKKEKINGLEMLRVEHTEKDFQPTVTYYISKGDSVYRIHLFPYRKESPEDIKDYNDFLEIVQSFKLIQPPTPLVTFPKAGDVLVEGQTYKITWTKPTNLTGASYMIHLENDSVGSILIGETSGTSISWKIPVILSYLGEDGPPPQGAPTDGYRIAFTPKNVSLADFESSRIYSSTFKVIPKK